MGIENPINHPEPIYYYHVEEVKPMMTTSWAPDEPEQVKETPDNAAKMKRVLELLDEIDEIIRTIEN